MDDRSPYFDLKRIEEITSVCIDISDFNQLSSYISRWLKEFYCSVVIFGFSSESHCSHSVSSIDTNPVISTNSSCKHKTCGVLHNLILHKLLSTKEKAKTFDEISIPGDLICCNDNSRRKSVLISIINDKNSNVISYIAFIPKSQFTLDIKSVIKCISPIFNVTFRNTAIHTPPPPQINSLTKRETEILKYLSHGLTNLEIANTLSLSSSTVKNHIMNIFPKILCKNRTEASNFYKSFIDINS